MRSAQGAKDHPWCSLAAIASAVVTSTFVSNASAADRLAMLIELDSLAPAIGV
jgi:hypothetical protein